MYWIKQEAAVSLNSILNHKPDGNYFHMVGNLYYCPGSCQHMPTVVYHCHFSPQ